MLNKYFYNLSVTIIGIVVSVFILTCTGTLFHIPVNPLYVLIPFAAGIYYLKKQSSDTTDFLKQFLFLLLIIMFSYFISISVWDYSWDGRSSHIATAIMYKNGWLPVYQNYKDFADICHIYYASAFWGNCYLHLNEIIGANIYKLTNLIESAKAINFVMLSCLFMYSAYIFREFFQNKKVLPFLISALLILNPVCICQWFTNDVDLQLYIAFSLLILTIIKIEKQKFADKKDLFLFVCTSLMLAMIKFTGSMYIFIICLMYFAYLLLQKRDLKKYIKTVFVIGGLIIITGVNPFFTNYRDFGHPFHPLFGKNKINIIDESIPYGFQNMSRLEKFFRSTFSESVNSMNNALDATEVMRQPVFLKIPFTIHQNTVLHNFCHADVRVGGFGYFWSGILLLSMLYLPFIRFRDKNEKNIFWLITAMILITTLANPHCWWARYVPQFWMFPFFILFFGFQQTNYNNKFSKIMKLSLLCIIMLSFFSNSFIVMKQNTLCSILATFNIKKSYKYINFIKRPTDKIYLMRLPAYENMVIADETIIPHLEEYFGKESIVYVPFDRNKLVSEDYFLMQKILVVRRPCYFVKVAE